MAIITPNLLARFAQSCKTVSFYILKVVDRTTITSAKTARKCGRTRNTLTAIYRNRVNERANEVKKKVREFRANICSYRKTNVYVSDRECVFVKGRDRSRIFAALGAITKSLHARWH